MTKVLIETDDVVGAFEYKFTKSGSHIVYRRILLARVAHELEIKVDFDFEDRSPEHATRYGLSLTGVEASVLIRRPPPEGEQPTDEFPRPDQNNSTEPVRVNGNVVLVRTGTKDGLPVYRVLIGVLRCTMKRRLATPMLRLWPCAAKADDGWEYWFMPEGLGLRGPLRLANPGTSASTEHRVTLRLPQAGPQAGDVAWTDEGFYFYKWENKAIANRQALAEDYKMDSPELTAKPWPGKPQWVIRRWHLMTEPDAIDFVRRLTEPFAPDATLSLSYVGSGRDPSVEPNQPQPPCAEIVELRDVDYVGARESVHRGVVVSSSAIVPIAKFLWPQPGRTTLCEARYARAGLLEAGTTPPSLARKHFTLLSQPRFPPERSLSMSWKPTAAGSPLFTTELGRTPLVYAGLAGQTEAMAAMDTTRRPSHLCIEQGSLSVDTALGDTESGPMASALVRRASSGAQLARGGVPVQGDNVATGLVVWAIEGGDGFDAAGLRIRLTPGKTELEVWDAVLTWRTPAWWLRPYAGDAGESCGLERFGPVFERRFEDVVGGQEAFAEQFEGALAELLCATLWVGHRRVPRQHSWELKTEGGITSLTIPLGLARKVTAWADIHHACLLNTQAYQYHAPGGLLLDPSRALVRLDAPAKALTLQVTHNELPNLAMRPIATPESAPDFGTAAGGEMFHPLIPGLTWDPATRRFQYRHGLPILANAWLRMRADGTLSDATANATLDTVRPVDDVAIVSIVDKDRSTAGFATTNGNADTKTLWIAGWIPRGELKLSSLHVDWSFNAPALRMQIPLGQGGTARRDITIQLGTNGFGEPQLQLGLDAKGDGPDWLEAAHKGSRTVPRNFGQPLLELDTGLRYLDGAGRRFGPFYSGERPMRQGGVDWNSTSTTCRATLRAAGASAAADLALALGDLSSNAAEWAPGSWDLGSVDADGKLQAPCVGAYPLLPISLEWRTKDAVRMKVRLGPPHMARWRAWQGSTAEVVLAWTRREGRWSIATVDGANFFDWHFPPQADGRVAVRRLQGTVSASGDEMACTVTRVTLATSLGNLEFATEPARLEARDRTLGCELKSVLDPETGFACELALSCDEHGQWTAAATKQPQWFTPQENLTVATGPGEREVTVRGLRLHEASDTLPDFEVEPHQSSPQVWAFAWHEGDVRLLQRVVGTLTVVPGSSTPDLSVGVRGTAMLNAAGLFGHRAQSGHVRGDLSFEIDAGEKGIRRYHASSVTGWFDARSDYVWRRTLVRGHEDFTQHARLFFDQASLGDDGSLKDNSFFAVVEHRFERKASRLAEGRKVQMQIAQRITVLRARNAISGLRANSLVAAVPELEPPPALWPQVGFEGHDAIGLAMYPTLPKDFAQSYVLRVPFSTEAGKDIILDVPAAAGAPEPVRWHPLQLPPRSPRSAAAEPWHWRGALAGWLAPSSLEDLDALQSETAAEPAAAGTWPEWTGVLEQGGRFRTGLFDKDWRGAMPIPFVVGVAPLPMGTEVDTISLGLLAPDAQGIFRQVASAVLQGVARDKLEPVDAWARAEARRLLLRGVTAAVARGSAVQPRLLRRSFEAAAVDDAELAGPVVVRTGPAPRSWVVDRMEKEQSGYWSPPVKVLDQPAAVLEVVESAPVLSGVEAGRVSSVALASLWTAVPPQDDPPGLAIGARREIAFGGGAAPAQELHRWASVHRKGDQEGRDPDILTLPPLVQAQHWVPRGGDRVITSFAASGMAAEGPRVAFALREARPNDLPSGADNVGLRKADAVQQAFDGVEWSLHRAMTLATVGVPDASQLPSGVRVTVVTPRNAMHLLAAATPPNELPEIVLERRLDKAEADPRPIEKSYVMTDPLLVGLLRSEVAPPKGVAWLGLARMESGTIQDAAVLRAGEGGWTVSELERWKHNPDAVSAIMLRAVPVLENLPGTSAANTPTAYSLHEGRLLRQLLAVPTKADVLPWVLNRPALVWMVPDGAGNWAVTGLARVVWLEGQAIYAPEQMLIASAGRVVGFGDLSAKASLGLAPAGDMFTVQRVGLGIERQTNKGEPNCWLFSSSGACNGFL